MLEGYKKYKSMQIALTPTAHSLRCDEDSVCFIAVRLEQLAVYPIFIS